jgi:hypothetical protein
VAPESLADVEAELERLPPPRRALVEAAVTLAAQLLLDEPPEALRKFLASGDLESPARLKNRARLQLLTARVQAESIRGSELRKRLGISRQRLAQLRNAGKLLGIQPPLRTEHWYPEWQFDAAGKVRPVVPALVGAAREARLTPLSLHLMLTNPDAGVEGSPLVELLDERPEDVVELVEAGTAQGT